MAELDPAPQEEQEPVVAPEVNDEPPVAEQPSDPVEALALEMGWAPKDQFRGDPADWKPAADFIKAGRDIQSSLRNDLRSMREQLARVTSTSAQLLQDKIAERDQYWQNVHRKAVEEGDVELAERAVSERGKLANIAAEPTLPPETTDFMSRNKWMGADPLATARAKEIADRLARDGYDIPTQLREVERAIRKEFPEHFPAPAKQQAGVTTAATRAANVAPRVKGFNEMPAESQKMALDYEKRLGIKREDFAKSYWADQAKAQRRVG